MKRRPTVTAALITLDEAENLAELLPALDWTDEIVVVDSGSRDNTVAVAEAFGCRVYRRRLDSFAAQRNCAIRVARADWILSIDADERPTPALVEEIRDRLANPRASAYRVPIRSTIFGEPVRRSGTQDDCPVRLFRRDAAMWMGEVHEVLGVSGRIGRLHQWLTHDTQQDLETFLRKMHRYTRLDAQARVDAGLRPGRFDRWIAPAREVFRRLIYKRGILDGPAGWKFCLLSGLYEWVLAEEHRHRFRLVHGR